MVGALILAELLVTVTSWGIGLLDSTALQDDPTRALRGGSLGSIVPAPLLGWWQGVRHGQLLLWDLPLWFSDVLGCKSFIRMGYAVAARNGDGSALLGMLLMLSGTAWIGAYTWAVVIHRLDLLGGRSRSALHGVDAVAPASQGSHAGNGPVGSPIKQGSALLTDMIPGPVPELQPAQRL